MLDLMAITAGVLSFLGWTAAMVATGIWNQRRREMRQQQQRVARLIADAKRAATIPDKVEPRRPEPSAETIRRAQA